MEEEVKISFWKKLKISIFGLEDYKKLVVQKTSKTISYIVILMLIFTFFLTLAITYRFSGTVNKVKQYIDQNIETINFNNGKISITQKENNVISTDKLFDGKVIIDTTENLTNEQINKYEEEIKNYYNGAVILQDKVILKTNMASVLTTISVKDIADQLNLVKFEKQDLMNALSGNNVYKIYAAFYIVMFIYLFVVYLSTVLLDAILYSLIRFRNVYNIAIYSMTLPIILNLIYIIVNILTGYTVKYFNVLYMAIACIYVIAAILIIRSDIIKQQIELSKIMQEQEKVRQEMEEKERQKKEEEERERIRKKDEKERQEQKKKSSNKKAPKEKGDTPEPQANIKTEEL